MNMTNPLENSTQARFSLEQARVKSLNEQLKNHENREDLMKTARQFEGIFFKQLLDAMDKTVERSGLMSGGSGEEMFRGMLYEKISETISTRPGGSGFGIAEAVYRQLESRLPEESQSENKSGGSAS